ncbi:MAG: hypothetical protein HYX33_01120 [Actinobacteria bacterium]|nr:hypothetical protein [Actinomycetota bacterium]
MVSAFETWLLNVVVVGSGIAMVVRGPRSGTPLAWSLVGVGFALWGLGNLYWAMRVDGLAVAADPNLADVAWLSAYPLWFIGLVMLVRRQGGRAVAHWLDAALAALAAGALVMNGSDRDRRWMLITGGFALFAVADCVYLVQSTFGGFATGTVVSLGWPLGALIVAVAADVVPAHRPTDAGGGLRSLVIPSASGAVALAVLVWGSVTASQGLATITATLADGGGHRAPHARRA